MVLFDKTANFADPFLLKTGNMQLCHFQLIHFRETNIQQTASILKWSEPVGSENVSFKT